MVVFWFGDLDGMLIVGDIGGIDIVGVVFLDDFVVVVVLVDDDDCSGLCCCYDYEEDWCGVYVSVVE